MLLIDLHSVVLRPLALSSQGLVRSTESSGCGRSVMVILVLRRLKQENCCKFKASLAHVVNCRPAWLQREIL